MTRKYLLGGAAAVALCSTLVMAQGQPEDLLPPGFDDPEPAPTAAPAPTATVAPAPGQPQAPEAPPAQPGAIVQPLPEVGADPSISLTDLPSLEELEAMSTDELDELLGLKPRYDIPPAARRSLTEIGVIGSEEGGLPSGSLADQPAALVRAALQGTGGQLVSRWGHILLRRALASRLETPSGMNPVEFAALRAGLLNRLGEHAAARALVQDVDTGNYNEALLTAALDAYVGTSDIVGACPAVRVADIDRDDGEWRLLGGICNAYAGEETRAGRDIRRILGSGDVPRIDALLAQRYAGAAGRGRRAVNIEWDDAEELTPWRFALANALGEEIPENLRDNPAPYYLRAAATAPALPLVERAQGADRAAADGILSSSAVVDLYSQIYAADAVRGDAALTASRLREAYVGESPAERLAAIRDVWGGEDGANYGRRVLTAYAAARMPASSDFADDAAELIGSMLTAGLDRDAMRWGSVVPQGSVAWGILALAQPSRSTPATDGQLASFLGNDASEDQQKSKMLLAGLVGLGRIGSSEIAEYSRRLDVDLDRQTRWTRAIGQAAQVDNAALVSILAGLGMQGSSWEKMTALHLYHIVNALAQVGLEAEARMIAAEAVARA